MTIRCLRDSRPALWSSQRSWMRAHRVLNIGLPPRRLERQAFSSFSHRRTAQSVLTKHGLSVAWLEKQQLVLRDNNDTLFSKRLGYDSREIRLLYIMPSADPNGTLEMIMAHCSLDSHPPYEALTYTGGNPYSSSSSKETQKGKVDPWDEKLTVMVNDIPFYVKRNLKDALLRFRKTHAKQAIWIDSICINEADPIERTEQVRLMGEVYGEANDVPIWLGEKTNGLRTALSLVTKIFNVFTKWYDNRYPAEFHARWDRMIRTTETTPDAIDQATFWNWLQSEKCKPFFEEIDLETLGVRTDRMAWDFLRDLLSRRWFDRVWTWQEKELAKNATVYVGNRTLSWAKLRFAMLLVMAHDLSETRATPSAMMPGREYLHVLDSLGVRKSPDLLDIVINVRHRDTQLRRDKIFGVLGAAARYNEKPSDDVEHFSRLVNYGYLTVEHLYKEFSRYWILEKRDLRVLQACNPSKRKIKNLPSWVVDWSDTTPSHQLSTRLYNACKGKEDVEVKYHYHVNSEEIHLRGVQIDQIKFVFNKSIIDKSERNLENQTVDADFWRAELVKPLASLYVAGIGRKDKSLLGSQWSHVVEKMEWGKSYEPTGQSMREAFWRTLLTDQNPYLTNAADRRIDPKTDIASIFHRWAHRRALTRSLLPESMRDRKDVDVATQRWIEALDLNIIYKRFFITQNGYIGLAPNNIQAGDYVCVFFGGKVPFSVRKQGSHYILVEETYLHGFMDGEAIKLAHKCELDTASFCIR